MECFRSRWVEWTGRLYTEHPWHLGGQTLSRNSIHYTWWLIGNKNSTRPTAASSTLEGFLCTWECLTSHSRIRETLEFYSL